MVFSQHRTLDAVPGLDSAARALDGEPPQTSDDLPAELADIEEDFQPSTSVPEAIDLPDAGERSLEDRWGPQSGKRLVIPIVVGTRPEAIKLVPVILALRESDFYQPIVISTGQHHRMVHEIFELAGITPDVTLWAGGRRELNERVASVMRRFEDFYVEWFGVPSGPATPAQVLAGKRPAVVLVHGDTSSAMASALAAFHLRIPVAHVEAGLRTGGLNLSPFPEELNRQLISCIACMHFAPTASNLESLVRENVPIGQVFVTGNTGIDALRWASRLELRFADSRLEELCASERRIVVVTAHRRESWGAGLDGIAEGVARLARSHPDVRFVVPMHPNPTVRESFTGALGELDNVLLIEPLGYATFARLLGHCHFVITDSGGIQEEAPALGKPVLVTRETTERREGVDEGTLRLVGTSPDLIEAEGARLLDDAAAYMQMSEAPNPYGDGQAAERITGALESMLLGTTPPVPFGPGYNRRGVLEAAGFSDAPGAIEAFLAARASGVRAGEGGLPLDSPWLM